MRVNSCKPNKNRPLSNEAVLRIRDLRFRDGLSYRAISEQTGVHPEIIRGICNWQTYKDVE